jgi:competence protein ComEC
MKNIKLWKYVFGILILILFVLGIAIFQLPDGNLHLIACDVGQGDAILAIYKNVQILTDGGIPNGKVLKCLSKHIPFWDREIEVVVNTHPQLDHYGGLIEVFKKYKVDYFVGNALSASASEYQVLRKEVGGSGAKVVNPVSGMSIRYALMSYDTFWPSLDFLTSEGMSSKKDPNDFSVQAILSFGEFDALLTGDIGENMADLVIPNLPNKTIEYIKIPHHGSKYGLTANYLKEFVPKIAVISVGKKNGYGHPTREILDLLKSYGIKTMRTDETGDIEIVSNGNTED